MQTIITILIIAAAGCYLIRRFYKSVKKGQQSTCGCSCDGCTPNQIESCPESDIQKQ